MLANDVKQNNTSEDSDAFHAFFKESYPQLMALACRFVDQQTARDLVQDVFLTYWEQRHSVQIDNLKAYLYKTLRNRCLDYLKHEMVVEDYKSRVRIAEARVAFMENSTDLNDVFSQVVSRNVRELIEQSVDKLPSKCAQAFKLCYFYDLPQKEIARIMDISIRTVESHIQKAISILRIDLRKILWLIIMFFSIK